MTVSDVCVACCATARRPMRESGDHARHGRVRRRADDEQNIPQSRSQGWFLSSTQVGNAQAMPRVARLTGPLGTAFRRRARGAAARRTPDIVRRLCG